MQWLGILGSLTEIYCVDIQHQAYLANSNSFNSNNNTNNSSFFQYLITQTVA